MSPAVSDERTIVIKPGDLAAYLGVTQSYLSRAVHNRWNAAGVDVELYAIWRTRNQNRVSHYELPLHIARDVIPKSDHPKYDL